MMDQLKLAQLYNKQTVEDKKAEILSKINIECCVSDEPLSVPDNETFAGYNCLHLAVMRSDLILTQRLLSLGADLLQQGSRDGKTPLHKAVDIKQYPDHKLLRDIIGELQKDQLVETLLSTQVKSNNKSNPKCNNGLSHLHIACMFNHATAVEFFINAGESLDQATNLNQYFLPGFTPLHFAVKYSSAESAEILLKNGADIHSKNAKGLSPIHLMIEHLLYFTQFITTGRRAPISFYEQEIERMNSIIHSVLKTRKDTALFTDEIGLSAFHLACSLKDSTEVKRCLEGNVDINSPLKKHWPGWTPLHFAAFFNVETLKLLLQNEADFHIKDAEGFTALEMCLRMYTPQVLHDILSTHDVLKNVMFSDASTKLSDVLVAANDCNRFEEFLNNLTDVNIYVPLDAPLWQGYSILHLVVSMNERVIERGDFMKQTDSKNKIDSLPHKYNCTIDEEAAYWKRIEMCLEKGCSVSAKNSDGLSPIHLAFKRLQTSLVRKLLKYCKENVADPNDLSLLHIACAVGNDSLVEQFLQQGADVNARVASEFKWKEVISARVVKIPANATPLHIAAAFAQAKVAKRLVERGADLYAEDSLGLTPIHLTMVLCRQSPEVIEVLFDIADVRDVVHESGLSYVHAAAFNQVGSALEKLLQQGADANRIVRQRLPKILSRFDGWTPLHSAGFDQDIVRILVEHGADVTVENLFDKHETPLLELLFEFEFQESHVEALKRSKDTGPVDSNGLTRLHVACATFDVDWARELLEAGADANAQVFTHAEAERSLRPLHFLTSYADFAEDGMPRRQVRRLVRLMLEHAADVLCVDDKGNTPLHVVYRAICSRRSGDDEAAREMRTLGAIADLMLGKQKSYSINPENGDGVSHFHIACTRNNVKLVEKFLDNGIDVNLSTYPFGNQNTAGFTPLHFALQRGNAAVALLLMERGADVRAESCNGNTPLHVLIESGYSSQQLIEMLLSQGADIKATNVKNETPIELLIHYTHFHHNNLQLLLNRGSSVDIRKNALSGEAIFGLALANAMPLEMNMVFETLIERCDVKTAIENGFSAIHNAVSVRRARLSSEVYLNIIELLLEMGCELDDKDLEDNTALHAAISFSNVGAVKALLLLGADLNLVEKKNAPSLITKVVKETTFGEKVKLTLLDHLWKISLTNLNLVGSIQVALENFEWTIHANTLQQIQNEFQKAKTTNISQSLTVGSFLSEWGAVIDYPMMSIVQRQSINEFFKDSRALFEQFPKFSGLIMMQYRKALARMKLMQPVKDILVLSGICLPDLCLEAVLIYFQNVELEFLINESDEVIQPCKRQKVV